MRLNVHVGGEGLETERERELIKHPNYVCFFPATICRC